jgi:hypothetical protein
MLNRLGDLFIWCNDILENQKFYSTILELEEGWSDLKGDESGYKYVGYLMNNNLRLHFLCNDQISLSLRDWAKMPPHNFGKKNYPSWTIGYSLEQYRSVLKNLKSNKIDSIPEKPVWKDGYWGISVKDPMGYTVFLFCETENQNSLILY